MLRKLLLGSVASLGLLVPLLGAAAAHAHESRHQDRHEYRHVGRYEHGRDHAYVVYFRDSCNRDWSCGGSFRSRSDADRFAEGYRYRGFEISIR